MFHKLINPQLRNTLITDIASLAGQQDNDDSTVEILTRPTPVPAHINALLISLHMHPPRQADFPSSVTVKGITYTVASKHLGNSCVLVSTNKGGRPYPVQIQSILRVVIQDTIKTLFIVQRYTEASVSFDPYTRYPALCAKMWSRHPCEDLTVVTVDDIQAHFAACPITWRGSDATVVISLSREIN